jgi:peptide/nickel transport system ATP-binding protein/oligopeptide transport system ATP-binding protein
MKHRDDILLEILNLQIHFTTYEGVVRAVDGLNLTIKHGEVRGLVGETGCGKSVTALSLLRLIPCPPGKMAGGKIFFKGEDLLIKNEDEMQNIRGDSISMIFQEPGTALNPVYRVGEQMMETLHIKKKMKSEAKGRVLKVLELVGMPDVSRIFRQYPYELSGGMQQRVMIAMALLCEPELLIADEPTTALDMTTQMQILELIRTLKEKLGFSILLITHDLGVAAEICDRISVMYAGNIIESGPVDSIFANPIHPYTRGLLSALPKIYEDTERLGTIPGTVPGLGSFIEGCNFYPRCEYKKSHCDQMKSELVQIEDDHFVACCLYAHGK